jgi:hypothetical protein
MSQKNLASKSTGAIGRRTTIRILAKAVVTLGVAIVAWRSRAFQVLSFLIAAALRRGKLVTVSTPATRATEWERAESPSVLSPPPINLLALITYHPEYHSFDPKRAIESLVAARRLGVGWLRTDVRWHAVFPAGDVPDQRALVWYTNFLRASSGCGLRNMVVLSSPPKVILAQSSAKKLESWGRFVETVADELGAWCSAYQLLNEPNNPVYSFFALHEAGPALIRGASIIHDADPSAQVVVNISMDIWGWSKYLQSLLQISGSSIDIIGLDHYPGTWTVGFHDRWAEVIQLADAIVSASPGSPWFKRRLAILETGFSTNAPHRAYRQQSEYLERVGSVARQLKGKLGESSILLGIYELCDGDTSAWLDPEAHFGVMTSDLLVKGAYPTLGHIVASL